MPGVGVLRERAAAAQDLTVEFEVGARLVESMLDLVDPPARDRLGDAVSGLRSASCSEQVRLAVGLDDAVALAKALKVKGLMNVQFAIQHDDIYILEVNPRASRTVPFCSKARGVPYAKIAMQVMLGKKLKDLKYGDGAMDKVYVKEAVFPFNRFPGTDIILGPEMRSTGEVMGIHEDFPLAFAKSQVAAGNRGYSTSRPRRGSRRAAESQNAA